VKNLVVYIDTNFFYYVADMHRAWNSVDDTSSDWFIKKNHCYG